MLTRLLAVYGAVIGTAALAWNVFIAVRDRARLKVFAGPDDPARRDVRPSHDTDARFLVHVQNRGRRSIAVERIWYTRRSMPGVTYLLTDRFDMGTEHLGEGESLTHEIYLRTVSPDDLDKIVVEAQDGRSWSGRYDKKAKPARWNA
jgi:hypothetical protein